MNFKQATQKAVQEIKDIKITNKLEAEKSIDGFLSAITRVIPEAIGKKTSGFSGWTQRYGTALYS